MYYRQILSTLFAVGSQVRSEKILFKDFRTMKFEYLFASLKQAVLELVYMISAVNMLVQV